MPKHVRIAGGPGERGAQLGEMLRGDIRATWSFYRDVAFGRPRFDLRECGEAYRAAIGSFRADYVAEMDAIAAASGLEPWQVAVLNARTEVMHRTTYRAGADGGASVPGECTAFYFPQSGQLAQNWDWLDALQALMVVVEIERPDGHRILQLTEPGIIGKIGLNDAGIGVCLNILSGRASPPAVPVHVLLRAVLDCRSIAEVRTVVHGAAFGTCSHMLVADDRGRSVGLELYGDTVDVATADDGLVRHTNHYVATPRDQSGDPILPSSHARWRRIGELLAEPAPQTLERARSVLADRAGGAGSICVSWVPLGSLRIGTLCGIVLDLPGRRLHLSPGPPSEHAFETFAL